MLFENIEYLYGLGIIPILSILFYSYKRWKRRTMKAFGDQNILQKLAPNVSRNKPSIKFNFLLFAFIFLVIGLANLREGSKLEEVKQEGIEIIFAIDVSNSMNAEDVKPSRLENTKQMLLYLLDRMQGNKVGIVIFAGDAYVQLPLTSDLPAAKIFISSMHTNLVPMQGSNMAEAVRLATKSLKSSPGKSKVLLITSDGEDHEGGALNEVQNSAKQGITVYTVATGKTNGGPIPEYTDGKLTGFLKNPKGVMVISKANPEFMKELANNGNGKFFELENPVQEAKTVFKELDKVKKTTFENKIFSAYDDRFQYFLGIALILIIIELLISERKSNWIRELRV